MSLDSDRSPDDEPTGAAPVTTERPHPLAPTFTPAPVPADSGPATEHAPDEPTIDESAPAEPAADETAAGEPTADWSEPTPSEATAAEPVNAGAPGDEPAATDAAGAEPATGEPTASEVTAYRSSVAPAWDAEGDPTAQDPAGHAVGGSANLAADGSAGVTADRSAGLAADRSADPGADRAAGLAADGSADLAASPAERAADGPAGLVAGIEPTAELDGPLLSDLDELRASWQRIQAAFVDDPREAVTDAAGLVEHTAQALAGALRQRQRQLRAMWDREDLPDGVEYADSGGTAPRAASANGDQQAADGPDTEQLRLVIQRYRVLFNHLCRP